MFVHNKCMNIVKLITNAIDKNVSKYFDHEHFIFNFITELWFMISYISFYIHLFYITKKNKNITIIENSMTLKYVSLLFLLLVPFTFCDCPITLTPGQVIAGTNYLI